MTGVTLPVLLLSAYGLVAAGISAVMWLALPMLDRVVATLPPRHRVRAWLGAAALPAVLGAGVVVVTLLPAFGLGSDHCLAHDPHHPHLCPHHASGWPSWILVAVAAWVLLRFLATVGRLARTTWLGRDAARTLREASEHHDGLRVLPTLEPKAFVLGVARPAVHVSRGLLDLGEEVAGPVLAHERAHARARDTFWRALLPLLAGGHLPPVASHVARRLCTAQEMAADAEAARDTGDAMAVARSLVRLARAQLDPVHGLSFVHGDLEARVRALIDPPAPVRKGVGAGLLAIPVASGFATVVLRHDVHHALETVLGVLS